MASVEGRRQGPIRGHQTQGPAEEELQKLLGEAPGREKKQKRKVGKRLKLVGDVEVGRADV